MRFKCLKKIIVILIFVFVNNFFIINLVNADNHSSLVKKAWLGVQFQTFKDSVVIVSIAPESPAEKYGLEVGDFFVSIDEKEKPMTSGLFKLKAIYQLHIYFISKSVTKNSTQQS